MPEQFRVTLHPDLSRQLRELEAKGQRDPNGLEDRGFKSALEGLQAIRDGREAEFSGERLGFSPRHPDLRDCAEIKVPVVEEFNRRGRPFGPSHRITYREFDAMEGDSRPIREAVAFEPRKDGRPFTVTAQRLGRSTGRSIEALEALPNVQPMVGDGKDPNRPISPARQPLPPELAAAVRAASNPSAAHAASTKPSQTPQVTTRTSGPESGRDRDR